MIAPPTLLFPDTGEDFIRALRAAVLYSEQVNLYTITDPRLAEPILLGYDEAVRQLGNGVFRATEHPRMRRVLEYCRFIKDNQATFTLLTEAGVLQSRELLTDSGKKAFDVATASHKKAQLKLNNLLQNKDDKQISGLFTSLQTASISLPPLSTDVACILNCLIAGNTDMPEFWETETEIDRLASTAIYLMYIAVNAEALGTLCSTWQPSLRNALWALRNFVSTEEVKDHVHTRNKITDVVARTVLERSLPRADDLPFEELLHMRERRGAELEAFRIGIAEVVAQIDPTLPPDRLALAMHDLISIKIEPSVQALKASLYSCRLEALRKIGRSSSSAAAATFPAVIAFAAGAPLDASLILSFLGAAAGAALDATIESRKLAYASQWSLLLRLRKTKVC